MKQLNAMRFVRREEYDAMMLECLPFDPFLLCFFVGVRCIVLLVFCWWLVHLLASALIGIHDLLQFLGRRLILILILIIIVYYHAFLLRHPLGWQVVSSFALGWGLLLLLGGNLLIR
jgi:hypothetical protein